MTQNPGATAEAAEVTAEAAEVTAEAAEVTAEAVRVLALDPASSTGYARCAVSKRTNRVEIVDYGIVEVKNEPDGEFSSVGRTCNSLKDKVSQLLDPMPEYVYIEDYFFSSRFTRGVNLNLYLRGSVCMLLDERGIKYKFLSPSQWKSFVTGTKGGRPSRAMKEEHGKSANKTVITQKLAERYGIRFPEKIVIGGRLRKFKYDVSDAVGIAFCGIHTDFPAAVFPAPAPGAEAEASGAQAEAEAPAGVRRRRNR